MSSRLLCASPAVFLALALHASSTDANAADASARAQFAELHALIKPRVAEQKWEQIPWLTSLWEARQKAAREGKPILLWEMDGHPLGCT
ncbi:MAG: hypothetical protein FJ386_12215 [Verrucomicrobia bacterium]|nr:hypothetical protein [Verrucomicrobiota bacterium]